MNPAIAKIGNTESTIWRGKMLRYGSIRGFLADRCQLHLIYSKLQALKMRDKVVPTMENVDLLKPGDVVAASRTDDDHQKS